MEVLIRPDSASESQEAVNMDQKEIEKNLPSVPAMHRLRKGKAGEEVGNGAAGAVVMQGWHGCHALQGDVHLQQQHRGS